MAHRVPAPKWLPAFMLALSADESEIMGDLEFSVTNVLFISAINCSFQAKKSVRNKSCLKSQSIN